jgi:hypothetical protein
VLCLDLVEVVDFCIIFFLGGFGECERGSNEKGFVILKCEFVFLGEWIVGFYLWMEGRLRRCKEKTV